MGRQGIYSPEVATPRKGISQGIKAGNMIFVSGQVGETADGFVPEGIEAQTELAIKNCISVLEAAGASLNDVTMCRCFLKNEEDFDGMNKAYAKYFEPIEPGPGRYTVLASPVCGFLIEIAMYAVV